MLIKFLLLTLAASFVNAVFLLSGETDKMIRSHLLNALKRSYLLEEPQVLDIPEIRESSSATGRYFPFDIKQILVSEFLDFTDFPKLSQIDCSFNDSLKRIVIVRLVNFHPHFATDNSLVNSLLYNVLSQHFRPVISSNDPLFHDHLQLLAAKYFFDDLDFDVIPLNIYHYIICFMFELIYETDIKTPNSKREFLNQFVYSLVMASEKNSMEQSYKYVLSKYQSKEIEYEYFSVRSNSSSENSIIQDYEEFSEEYEQDGDESLESEQDDDESSENEQDDDEESLENEQDDEVLENEQDDDEVLENEQGDEESSENEQGDEESLENEQDDDEDLENEQGDEESLENEQGDEESSENEQDDDEVLENEDLVNEQAEHLQFFYSKPSFMDIRKRFKIKQFRHLNPISSIRLKNVRIEFKNAILEIFLHKFQSRQLLKVYDDFCLSSYYSSRLAERFMADERLLMAIGNYWWCKGKYMNIYLTASKLGNMNIMHKYEYLVEIVCSTTPKNLLGYDQLCHTRLNLHTLVQILEAHAFSLSKIDAWSKLMTKHRNMTPRHFFPCNAHFCEMLVKEKYLPFDDDFLRNAYNSSHINTRYARLFLTLFQSDDPFIFLYYSIPELKKVKHLIQDRFDLNKRYTFDEKIFNYYFLISNIGYNIFKAQTYSFSFKSAINSCQSKELKEIFSSNPDEFDDYSNISKYSIVKQPRDLDNVFLQNNDQVVPMEPEEISRTSQKGIFTDNFRTDVALIMTIMLFVLRG
jgi:hypothetical protein